jgi:NADPH:quinone reductase-like Zn-dependent oxidoreductase
MQAARIHRFGPPDVLVVDEVERPTPGEGELLVRLGAAGVGPWDALIREGKSVVDVALPITLGSDLAGTVESVGTGGTAFKPGDEVFGVTNKNFCGAYAEFAVVQGSMVAPKPRSLTMQEAASVPVVAVTAWQMLFDYAQVKAGQTVLIHGAAGNVGAYAVQLARRAGLRVIATAGPTELDRVRGLGADDVLDYKSSRFEEVIAPVDVVIDTVGGETRRRSFSVLKPGGILVSSVSPIPDEQPRPVGVRSVFFLVDVTTPRLKELAKLFDEGKLSCEVGTVLPLAEVRTAHEMLAGRPHNRGKIVLRMPRRVVIPTPA